MHPLRVLNAVEGQGEDVAIAAVLHDVIEDSSVTIDDLRRAGFSETILTSLGCLTHSKEEPYAEYVIRCHSDETARRVKLADLQDNARPTRALLRPDQIEPDMARLRKYLLAYKFLAGFLTQDQYLNAMNATGMGDGKGSG
jgi:(p)ppGpp synthase/HD superfamily hydrolase